MNGKKIIIIFIVFKLLPALNLLSFRGKYLHYPVWTLSLFVSVNLSCLFFKNILWKERTEATPNLSWSSFEKATFCIACKSYKNQRKLKYILLCDI